MNRVSNCFEEGNNPKYFVSVSVGGFFHNLKVIFFFSFDESGFYPLQSWLPFLFKSRSMFCSNNKHLKIEWFYGKCFRFLGLVDVSK